MSDEGTDSGVDVDVKMFGDPRSADVYRGRERRADALEGTVTPPSNPLHNRRATDSPTIGSTLGMARGDGFATFLYLFGLIVLIATLVTSSLILYNAQNVGAFDNPWDSTRVAIGLAVLAVGTTQGAILIALSRATTFLVAIHRAESRRHD